VVSSLTTYYTVTLFLVSTTESDTGDDEDAQQEALHDEERMNAQKG